MSMSMRIGEGRLNEVRIEGGEGKKRLDLEG